MVTVVTREANGIPLTHDQVDDNFTNLAGAINNLGDDVLAPAIAAKDVAVGAANSASASANNASNSANAASISSGSAATSAESASADADAAAASALASAAASVALRNDLLSTTGTNNVKYGARTVTARLDDEISILKYNAAAGTGSTDCVSALQAARTACNRAHFPRLNDQPTTYFFNAFSANAFSGMTITSDPGVTLSFADSAPYSLYNSVIYGNDIPVVFRDISIKYTFLKTPTKIKKDIVAITPSIQKRKNTALTCTDQKQVVPRYNDWDTSDAFPIAPSTATANALSFAATGGAQVFRGGFVALGVWETVSAYFDNGLTPGPIGVIIRGSGGFAVIYSNGASGSYKTATKLLGTPSATPGPDLAWPQLGQGSYTSYAPDNSVWSVTRISVSRCVVKLNGKAITAPFIAGVGTVQEVGFVCFGSNAFSVSGFTVERRTDAVMGMPSLTELRIFGDSTAEKFPTYWGEYLPQILDDLYGLEVSQITNYAVNGETLDQQYVRMQTQGFGNAYYVFVCAGTNNIQMLQSLAGWTNTVTNVLNYIIAAGRKPIFISPWLWYTQAQSGGTGQPSVNYDKGAPYRMILERLCAQLGVLLVKTTDDLPNPSPALLTSSPQAPLLRDNIHQDQLAFQLYAMAISKVLAEDYLGCIDGVEDFLSASMMLNGATAQPDLRFAYDKLGNCSIAGTLGVVTIADGTQVFKVPRHVIPSVQLNVLAAGFSSSLVPLGTCWLSIDPATGAASLSKVPATTTTIILSGATWKTAAS